MLSSLSLSNLKNQSKWKSLAIFESYFGRENWVNLHQGEKTKGQTANCCYVIKLVIRHLFCAFQIAGVRQGLPACLPDKYNCMGMVTV